MTRKIVTVLSLVISSIAFVPLASAQTHGHATPAQHTRTTTHRTTPRVRHAAARPATPAAPHGAAMH